MELFDKDKLNDEYVPSYEPNYKKNDTNDYIEEIEYKTEKTLFSNTKFEQTLSRKSYYIVEENEKI